MTLGKTVYVNANYGKLPAGYTECEYLESTGTQYINTGIYPSLKDTGFDIVASSAKFDNRLFGISQTIGGTIYRFRAYCGSVNISMYVGTDFATIPAKTNSPVRFRTSGGVFRIDDNAPVSWIGTNAVFSVPFLLCAEYDDIVRRASTRLFSAKLYNNDSLIRDFVPCLNPSNVPGMYDLVGATFYPNAGTGDFLYSVKALDGTSWSSPYTNLQDAVTYAVAGDLVLVTNGVYSPISTGNKAITIQSVEGSSVTSIDGGGTTRCATLGTGVALKGFTVFNGYTTSGGGGVVYGSVYDSVVSNNLAATYGGGIYGPSVVSNCVIRGNTANDRGGGSHNSTLIDCTISGNTANGNGGGSNGGTLTDCVISGNTANQSGGGFSGSTLFNSVISNNIAVVNGGGGYNGSINSCIVVGNTAPTGSQIRNQDVNFYAYNSTIIGECSFANSTRDILNNIFYGSNITFPITAQVGFNTFSGTQTGGTIVGPNLASTDPQFTDPANDDFTLLPTSPCINKGANQYVTTATDLLGSPRIKDWRVDMGAYESQSTRFVTTPNALFPMGTKDVYRWTPLELRPIAWWKGENDATDSVGEYAGTWAGTERYTDGMTGRAFDFAVNNSKVDAASLYLPAGAITLAAWAKVSNHRDYNKIVGAGYLQTANGMGIHGRVSTWALQNRTGGVLAWPGVPHNGSTEWVHVVGVRTTTNLMVFVNGVVGASIGVGGSGTPKSSMPVEIGGVVYSSSMQGLIDDVLIFDRALSPTEVKKLYDETVKQNGEPW